MTKKYLQAAPVLLLAVFCAACTTIPSTPKTQAAPRNAVTSARSLVWQSMRAVHNNPYNAAARAKLDKAIHATEFAQLPARMRYLAIMYTSVIASKNGEYKKAHKLAVRGTAFAIANPMGWDVRRNAALDAGQYVDAGRSLTTRVERWPTQVDTIERDDVVRLQHYLRRPRYDRVDRKMLAALFHAGWLADSAQPNWMWEHLILLDLQHGDIRHAAAVAKRITSAHRALSMLVDKRFDALTSRHPPPFNIKHLLAAHIKTAQQRVKTHPDRLEPIVDLQGAYLTAGEPKRALAASDAVVAQARKRKASAQYTDFGDEYNWILNDRARAYEDLGRWKEAVHAQLLAARQLEGRGLNVSQRINLGSLYARLKQPDKAAHAVTGLTLMTGYGRMQLEMVKLKIAVEKHDSAGIKKAIAYLRKHQSDAIGTWYSALLYRGQLDAAAAVLIRRLQKPLWRNAALVAMQGYAQGPETPATTLIDKRWNHVAARPDVQAALNKVGRIEPYSITSLIH